MKLHAIQSIETITEHGQIDLFGVERTQLIDGTGRPVKQIRARQESAAHANGTTAKAKYIAALQRDRKQQIDEIHNLPLAAIIKENKNIHIVNINRELKK
jgi:hypothetical protein